MAKISGIRKHGAIPDRQHDAFLLALLLALFINIAFFAVQALIPKIAMLIKLLGPERQTTRLAEPAEPELPFVLVDPSLFDEEPDPDQASEAMSDINRIARQTAATPDLPEGAAYREEGIEELLSLPEGNPGPAISYPQSPSELRMPEAGAPAESPDSPEEAEEAAPVPDLPEVREIPDQPPEEPLAPLEDIEPLPEAEQPPAPEAPPEPPQEAPQEAPRELPPEPESEPATMPEPLPEASSEPLPEPARDIPSQPDPEPHPLESEPAAAADPLEEATPADIAAETAEIAEIPVDEMEQIELAMAPRVRDDSPDPRTRRLEETSTRDRYIPPPPPERLERRERPAEPVPEPGPRQPNRARQPRQAMEPAPEPRESRPRRQPVFRKIGPRGEQGGGSVAGGAPPRKSTGTSVNMIDADPSMALLAHRYGPYMRKLVEQLQASLLRQIILNPSAYSRGQVKIRFGISPDGTLTYYDTIFPLDSLEAERLMSERMLMEAAPFEPLTPQMQADELFQKMTVIVNLF